MSIKIIRLSWQAANRGLNILLSEDFFFFKLNQVCETVRRHEAFVLNALMLRGSRLAGVDTQGLEQFNTIRI